MIIKEKFVSVKCVHAGLLSHCSFSYDCDKQEVVHSALFSALSSVNEGTVVCGSEIQNPVLFLF